MNVNLAKILGGPEPGVQPRAQPKAVLGWAAYGHGRGLDWASVQHEECRIRKG